MKAKVTLLILWILVFLAVGCNLPSPGEEKEAAGTDPGMIHVDYSALEQFVELAREDQPDTIEIEALLKTPGFRGMIHWQQNNWSSKLDEDAYRNMLYSVFLPDQYTLREIEGYQKFADRIRWGKENYSVILKFISRLKPVLDSTNIYSICAAYLPEYDYQPLNVYFVIGLNQGAASEEGNFIDPDFNISREEIQLDLIPTIAHEAHHTFRMQRPVMTLTGDKYIYLLHSLFMLESEGFANSVTHSLKEWDSYIQKQEAMLDSGEEINFRIRQYIGSYDYMTRFNEYLKRHFAKELEDPKAELKSIFWTETDTWPAFHPVGQRMAYVIDKQFGREKLVSSLGHPGMFISAYNEAALEMNMPDEVFVFDQQVIDSIQDLPWIVEEQ